MRMNDDGKTVVFKDFAHAPSKVRATVAAVKEVYADKRVVAVMELHTYSSLNKDFIPQYNGAADGADVAFVFYSHHAMQIKRMPPLDPRWVEGEFHHSAIKAVTEIEELREEVLLELPGYPKCEISGLECEINDTFCDFRLDKDPLSGVNSATPSGNSVWDALDDFPRK